MGFRINCRLFAIDSKYGAAAGIALVEAAYLNAGPSYPNRNSSVTSGKQCVRHDCSLTVASHLHFLPCCCCCASHEIALDSDCEMSNERCDNATTSSSPAANYSSRNNIGYNFQDFKPQLLRQHSRCGASSGGWRSNYLAVLYVKRPGGGLIHAPSRQGPVSVRSQVGK